MVKKKKSTNSKSKSKRMLSKKSKVKKTASIIVLIVIIVVLAVISFIKLSDIKDQSIVAYINVNIINAGTKELTITQQELDQSYNFLFFITGYPEEYKQIITEEAYLEQMINENILLEEAEKQGFDVDNAEVDKKIEEMLSQNLLTEEQFKDRLNEAGFSFDYFKGYYENQLIISEFLNETLFSQIEIDDSEIREYYENNKESYSAKEGEIRARHILVNTKEEALEVIKEIRKGADFIELAKEKSIGPSAARGGDLGFFGRGAMVKEFEDVVFALRTGQISEPVETEYGWHIIKREHGIIQYGEAKELIKETLLIEKQKQVFQDYLDGLKTESEIIINLDGVEMPTAFSVENTCIDDYRISSDTVIFYHADWCPHCQRMISIVEDLEEEGYKFLWAETSSGTNTHIVVECFSDVIQGGVPEFICAGTSDYELGEMSKRELKNFADACQ